MSIERPTFHESWYRVADLRPRLRAVVQTTRQHFRGQRWHVLQDPSNSQFFRLTDAAYQLVGLLDGRRTVEQAWRICHETYGDAAPTQGEAINLLGQLYVSNLLRSDLPADAASMFELHRRRVHREIGGIFRNMLFVRLPLGNPDRLLERWERVLGPVFSPVGMITWLALMAAAIAAILTRGAEEFVAGAAEVVAPGNVGLLVVSFVLLKAVHELGHGIATKRIGRLTGRGGEVHAAGITLLVFTPVPFVDASSAWVFRSKWHRALVGVAGMYVELAVAALAAVVWSVTSPGTAHALAYDVIVLASVSTILFNGNPLLRFDGYYVLSDLLELPNLAQRGREQLHYLINRHAFGVEQALPAALTPGERWWLPAYAIAAAAYRTVIGVGIVLFLADRFFFVGAGLALAAIAMWVVVPSGRFFRYLLTAPQLVRTRPRAVGVTAVFLGAIITVVGLVPVDDRAISEGVVEPVDVAEVYAEVDGFVQAVRAGGQHVDPDGPPLVVLGNLELQTRRDALMAERELARLRRESARVSEVALAQSLAEQVDALDYRIGRLEEQIARLSVSAPQAGLWLAPGLERLEGAYVRQGESIGKVASVDRLFVRAVADQSLGPRIEPELGRGAILKIRVRGRPELELTGQLRAVLPAGVSRLPSAALGYLAGGSLAVDEEDETGRTTAEPFFEVQVDLAPGDARAARLCSGQRVTVRFDLPARPLALQCWRSLRQLVQRRFQI